MSKDTGGQAFPGKIENTTGIFLHGEMTLRDWLAGQIINGFMSNVEGSMKFMTAITKESDGLAKDFSTVSYLLADAMLKERIKE